MSNPHVMLTTLRNACRALHPQTFVKYSKQNLSILSLLLAHGYISSLTLGSSQMAHPAAFHKAPIPARMIVANLKYRGDRSVIGKLDSVSIPSRPIFVDKDELARLVSGRRVKGARGVGLGEMLLVRSRNGAWYEGRDAVRQGLGGEVMVKVAAE